MVHQLTVILQCHFTILTIVLFTSMILMKKPKNIYKVWLYIIVIILLLVLTENYMPTLIIIPIKISTKSLIVQKNVEKMERLWLQLNLDFQMERTNTNRIMDQ